MIDYLKRLSGDPPPGSLRVALVKTPAVYSKDRPAEVQHPEKRLDGDWAIVPGDDADLWSDTDTVAEIERDSGAVVRTRDKEIVGCLIPGLAARGGAVHLEAAAPGSSGLVDISDRQFAQILAIDGVITEDEALAWAAYGELPIPIEMALQNIPEEVGQRFAARMLLASATLYERDHPLVPMLGGMMLYDAEALDDIWRRGAALL